MEYDQGGYRPDRYNPDDYGQDSYDRPVQRSPRKKKKRSKFSRFMRALGKYLAQMPAQTLVVIGGSIAVVLVAVILLIVLLPGGNRNAQESMGELSITDPTPTPSLTPTNTPTPTLVPSDTPNPDPFNGEFISVVGDTHELIPGIQERLVALGYMDMPAGGYTNRYGPATKNGIRRFQLRNFDDSDKWDGWIGAETYNLLMSEEAAPFFYRKGDTDDGLYIDTIDGVRQVGLVTKLQNRLIELGYMAAGSATGTYGNVTVEAVKLFQQYHGLTPVDGLAGAATLSILYTAEAMDAVTGAANDRSKLSPSPDAAAASTAPANETPAP
ncbi:MAG: peptidoglycan-binding domain-containing protein [Clostridia bacterium]|nr:peptidoglycan-binding domain-containing protein [Clostridia bacterium]